MRDSSTTTDEDLIGLLLPHHQNCYTKASSKATSLVPGPAVLSLLYFVKFRNEIFILLVPEP